MPMKIVKLDVQVEGYIADPFLRTQVKKWGEPFVNLRKIKVRGWRAVLVSPAIDLLCYEKQFIMMLFCSQFHTKFVVQWGEEQAANGQAAMNRVILCNKT